MVQGQASVPGAQMVLVVEDEPVIPLLDVLNGPWVGVDGAA